MCRSPIRLDLNGPPDQIHGRVAMTSLACQDPHSMQSVGMIRLLGEDLQVHLLCLGQPSFPVMRNSGFELLLKGHAAGAL